MAERMQQDNLHSAITLRTITDFDCYALAPCSCCVDVKLTAPSYSEDGDTRAPIDLVAVIDRSGSMKGHKLDLVLKVLHFILTHLQPRDRFAIVSYDRCVEEVVSLSHVEPLSSLTSAVKIDQIKAGSSTNLSGGLIKGMNIMKERRDLKKADVASILLFTDGIANSGITNTGDIVTAMQNIYARKKSFSVNTFGFGSDHNVHMLKEISRVGNGLYYFIENTEQIPEIFTNCLGGLLSTVGQNISISIETSNGATVKKFISKDKPRLTNGNTKAEVNIGDIQSEEERDVLIEINLPRVSPSQQCSYGYITLKYFNVIKKDNDQEQAQLSLDRRSDIRAQVPSLEVDEQKCRIKTIACLVEAAALAEKGRLPEASSIISSQQEYISSSRLIKCPRVCSLTSDLRSARASLEDEQAYQSRGSSTLATLTDCHISQRSIGTPSYTTQSRASSYTSYMNRPTLSPEPNPPSQPILSSGEVTQPLGLTNSPDLATALPELPQLPICLSQSNSSPTETPNPTPYPGPEKGLPYFDEI